MSHNHHKSSSPDTRYLLLDSTYRDRYLYPDPGNYIIPFQKLMGDSIRTSVNPTTTQYPIYNFQWTTAYLPTPPADLTTFTGTIVGGSNSQPVLDENINALLGAGGANPNLEATYTQLQGVLRQLSFFYGTQTESYVIIEYDPINRVVTLDRPIPDFVVNKPYRIRNVSTARKIVIQGYNFDRLGSGSNNSGYLISTTTVLYLFDLKIREVKAVLFDGLTSLVCLDQNGFGTGWAVTDAYALFLAHPPYAWGSIVSLPLRPKLVFGSLLEWTLASAGFGYRQGARAGVVATGTGLSPSPVSDPRVAIFRIEETNARGEVISLTILSPGSDFCCMTTYDLFPINDDGTLGNDPPSFAQVVVTDTSPYVTVFSEKIMTADNYFVPFASSPMLFYEYPTNTWSISPTNSIPPAINRALLASRRRGTGTDPFLDPAVQNDVNEFYATYPIQRVFPVGKQLFGLQLQTGSADALAPINQSDESTNPLFAPYTDLFMIVAFSQDLCVPLNYSGSTVSSSQMICYGLRIVSLILPNQLLYTPYGGLTSAYPFVFVELTNESAPSGHNKITIYANNPNAVNSTFLCHISDVNSPLITKFIKLFSDGHHQIIKFRPNDNLKFRISLPDGETFITEEVDRLPPLTPNPLLQIVCLVEMVRLE